MQPPRLSARRLWALKNPEGFFNAEQEAFESLKFYGVSGRLADGRNCFFNQFSNWLKKPVPGAQVAGNDLKVRMVMSAV